MEQRLSFSGRFRVTLFDEDGNEEQDFGWQDNLITNLGLDYIATYPLTGSNSNLRLYCAVGTGAANPQVTDTALINEVMRTASTGGHSTPSDSITVVGDELVAKYYITRYFTFPQAYALTEMMFSPTSDSGAFNRELFRDGVGNPIQISVIEGKQMKIDHELTVTTSIAPVESSFDIDEYDAGMNLIDSQTVNTTQVTYGTSSGVFTTVLQPSSSVSIHLINEQDADTGQGSVGIHNPQVTLSPQTYLTGTYSRTKRGTISTASGNITYYGMTVSQHGTNSWGVKTVFDQGVVKDNVHELIANFTVSWGRG